MEQVIRRIGVLTSGGDAPGMNAAIRAVVRTCLGKGIECIGIQRGYHGLINGDFQQMDLNRLLYLSKQGIQCFLISFILVLKYAKQQPILMLKMCSPKSSSLSNRNRRYKYETDMDRTKLVYIPILLRYSPVSKTGSTHDTYTAYGQGVGVERNLRAFLS